jgi:hypothetical protein
MDHLAATIKGKKNPDTCLFYLDTYAEISETKEEEGHVEKLLAVRSSVGIKCFKIFWDSVESPTEGRMSGKDEDKEGEKEIEEEGGKER